MKQEFFKTQLSRLHIRFGQKAFDSEFVQLVWREVHDMSETGFQRFCDVLIGSRTAHKPPLLSEFREARMNEQKLRFDNEVKAAANVVYGGRMPTERRAHVLGVLSQHYGKVSSITEALEVAKIRRLTRAPEGPEGA